METVDGPNGPLIFGSIYLTEGTFSSGTSLNYELKQTYSAIASIGVASVADQSIANGTAILGLPTTNPTDLTHRKMGNLGATTIGISGSGSSQEYVVTSNQSGLEGWIGTRSILYGNSLPDQATDQGRLVDPADLQDGDVQGVQQISAKNLKLTFTSETGSTFRQGATFNFSMDGRQEVALQNKLETVPEPASITFFAIGGLCLMGRRKRR